MHGDAAGLLFDDKGEDPNIDLEGFNESDVEGGEGNEIDSGDESDNTRYIRHLLDETDSDGSQILCPL